MLERVSSMIRFQARLSPSCVLLSSAIDASIFHITLEVPNTDVEEVVGDVERTERIGKRGEGIRGDESEGKLMSTFTVLSRLHPSMGTGCTTEGAA
jgi:hypothetical protein